MLCGPGLPEDFSSKDYRPSPGPYCFIEQLCELHDGLVLEAKGVKEHFWKPFIKKLFHKRVRPTSASLTENQLCGNAIGFHVKGETNC